MSWQADDRRLSVLAVIPARGGSKGIPGKNLKPVGGLSLVGRAARLASSLTWIDRVIVTTDDPESAAEAVRHGAEAPFLRPAGLAGDAASSDDMWRHAWESAEEHYGRRFDVSLLLEPTSPLRRPQDLVETMEALQRNGSGAATVSPTPAHFTPHKTLTVDAGGVSASGPRVARATTGARTFRRSITATASAMRCAATRFSAAARSSVTTVPPW